MKSLFQRRYFSTLKVDNPYLTNEIASTYPFADLSEISKVCFENRMSQQKFQREATLEDRKKLLRQAIDELTKGKNSEDLALSISAQMGKPLAQARNELVGCRQRAYTMIELSNEALSEVSVPNTPGFQKRIILEPVGQILTLAPWNYPLLTAINSVAPAILAGCSVVLSHGPRTPSVSFFFEKAFKSFGLPVDAICTSHDIIHQAIKGGLGDTVVFTGSVGGGHAVNLTLGSLPDRFVKASFELGGKDPVYVCSDVNDIESAAASIVDGAFYNSGQSCCAVERVYVDDSIHDKFVEACKVIVDSYVLGDPRDLKTTLGPMAQPSSISFLTNQVKDALKKGARIVTGKGHGCTDEKGNGRFFSPTLLDKCENNMEIVQEESFGPVLPIIKVKSENEAIEKMNDSRYGLTAAIYTSDVNKAERIGLNLKAGTIFMNRCDYLDPYMPFSGRKDSGNGIALSKLGFSHYVVPKSLHFRL